MCSLPNGYDTTDTSLNISITSSQRLELCFSFYFGAMMNACFAKDNVGAARDESPRLLYIRYHSLPYASLLLLISPNRHRTYEVADNLSFDQVGIRLPSFDPYRPFKRKRIVEDSLSDF